MTRVYLKNWPLNRNLVVVVTVVNVAGMVGGRTWMIWVQFILSLVTVTGSMVGGRTWVIWVQFVLSLLTVTGSMVGGRTWVIWVQFVLSLLTVTGSMWVIWVQFILSLVTVTGSVVECRLMRIASMPRKNYHVLRGYIAAVEWGVKYLFCCVYIICLLCCIYAK